MYRRTIPVASDLERVLHGVSLVLQQYVHVNKEALLKNMLVTGMQPFSVPSAVSVPPSPTISGTPLNILDHEPRPTSLGDWQPSQTTKTREYKEVRVPSGSVDRAFQFGTLAAQMALGTVTEAVSRGLGVKDPVGSLFLNQANADRLAAALCRMRGAALKIGQMLSLVDDTVLPPVVTAALERVRAQADVMPHEQLVSVMSSQFGRDWRSHFGKFEDKPIAAASIGQVHRATLPDGTDVAVKVQYPGVADSIDSDLKNLERLLTVANVFPRGMYLEDAMEVARAELRLECDYEHEAENQERYRACVGDSPFFSVPAVVRSHSTKSVLTTTWAKGVSFDHVVSMPQDVKNYVSRLLLRLTLMELFEFRFMQTDPNWGNFLYDHESGKLSLIDFGAAIPYSKEFMTNYGKLIYAATRGDIETLMTVSKDMKFLTGDESPAMRRAHAEAALVVGEPFAKDEVFDFHTSGIVTRVAAHAQVFSTDRLTPPPTEVYSLHRRLSGCFMTCIKLEAKMKCRDLLIHYVKDL